MVGAHRLGKPVGAPVVRRTAPILATLSLLLGSAVILLGGRMSASQDTLLIEAEELPSLADASPPVAGPAAFPEAPDPAQTAEVPAAPVHSRLVAPKIVAPPRVDAGDLEREAPRDPLSQLSLALPPPPKPRLSNKWSGTPFFRPVATESAVFQSMEHTVSIAGTESLAADETCLSDGVAWSCGVHARTAFRLWLRGRALVCKVPEGVNAVHIVAPCRLGKQDAGAWLVSNGWARAAPGGPYVEAEEQARLAGMGIFGAPPDTSGLGAVPALAEPLFEDQPILAE